MNLVHLTSSKLQIASLPLPRQPEADDEANLARPLCETSFEAEVRGWGWGV